MRKLQTKEFNRGNPLGFAGFAMGLAALFISLSGLAGAASTQVIVHKDDIAPGAVTAKALAKGAVTAKKIERMPSLLRSSRRMPSSLRSSRRERFRVGILLPER